MNWRLVVLLAAGCGAPPAAPPARAPIPPEATPARYEPPPASPPPASRVECNAFGNAAPAAPDRGKKIFDFAPISLFPLRRGPSIGDRPRNGLGRTSQDLRELFARQSDPIRSCWKHASSLGSTATTLTVTMTIEPLGDTRDLTVSSTRTEDAALVECVRAALVGAAFAETTTRPLRLHAELAFTRAAQPAWTRTWPAPGTTPASDPRAGTSCTHVIDDGRVFDVAIPKALEVSDWDTSREPRRNRQQLKVGCAFVRLDVDKVEVATAIESNRGALQRCYADARARDPHVGGEVLFQLAFDRSGATTRVQLVHGVDDPALHACLAAALREVWVVPGAESALEVNLPLSLASLPEPAPADPAALAASGDAEGALAAWTAKLRGPVSAEAACEGRAGVLLAIGKLAPWLDDPRVTTAIAELARAAELLAPERARACVAPVQDLIQMLTRARGEPVDRYRLTHVWLARYAAALPLAPYLGDGPTIRWFYATALLRTPRRDEAMAILRALAADRSIGPAVARSLETSPTTRIDDLCSD